MSLFKDDPHGGAMILYAGEKDETAKGAVIMLHGRGASADNILGLADEFSKAGFLYAAPQAAEFTWYPYSFIVPVKNNEPALSSALNTVDRVVNELTGRGIKKEKIILLGFSQGACLSLEYAARHGERYGGIAALSGGLIGAELNLSIYNGNFNDTPVFLGCSDIDPHIPLKRVEESAAIFSNMGAAVTKRIYPGMGHNINEDEIEFIKGMMDGISAWG